MKLKEDIVAYARSLGFARVGVTSAEPLAEAEDFLKGWLAEGRAGEMAYMNADPARRTRPADILPGAKSVISLAMSYYNSRTEDSGLRTEFGEDASHSALSTQHSGLPPEGRVARY